MLPRQGEDDPFCYVDSMIADAFQILCDHEDIDDILTFRPILSYSIDYIILYFQKQFINYIIFFITARAISRSLFTKESTLSVTMEIAVFVISVI